MVNSFYCSIVYCILSMVLCGNLYFTVAEILSVLMYSTVVGPSQ